MGRRTVQIQEALLHTHRLEIEVVLVYRRNAPSLLRHASTVCCPSPHVTVIRAADTVIELVVL